MALPQAAPESARIPLRELLLQRYEMLLLDELLEVGPEHLEVSAHVPAEHPLVDAVLGMPAWVGIEMMAQAVSAFSGLELRALGLPPRIGLLLGTRSYETRVPFFAPGDLLNVRVALAMRDAAGLGVFDCTIHRQGVLVAQAQVKGYMPDDIDAFLESGAHG